jgi:cell division protein FtsZ
MGIGIAAGEDRAVKAIDAALSSPLLDDNDIYGARGILLYISSGNKEVTMDEVSQITDYVQQAANNDTEIIWGVCQDPALDEEVSVTLIATGFGSAGLERPKAKVEKIRIPLDAPEQKVETAPVVKEEVKVVNVKEEQEVTFDMEVPQAAKSIEVMEEPEFVVRKKVEVKETEKSSAAADVNDMDRADMRNEIIRRKIGNVRLNDPNYINEMEKTPAFLRKNKKFEQITHSSQSHLSRYTLTDTFEDENGLTIGLKENSFLSDKPD